MGGLRDTGLFNSLRSMAERYLPASLALHLREFAYAIRSFNATGRFGMFSNVSVETTTRCNLACRYCPYSIQQKRGQLKAQDMLPELFSRILDDLAGLKFRGKLVLHGYGEPLLDEKLRERIAEARQKLPHAYIAFNSNGTRLTAEKLQKLIDVGLNHVYITEHQGHAETADNIREILENPRLKRHVSYYGPPTKIHNRGGAARLEVGMATPSERERRKACISAVNTLVVNVDGSVSVCHDDFDRKDLAGKIEPCASILGIWRSPKYVEARRKIRNAAFRGGKRTSGVCENCVVFTRSRE